jgi:hypothetical protein
MEDEIKRCTSKRKTALILDIVLQGKTTVAEASRAYDLPPSEIEEWVKDGKKGMENALRTKPLEIKEQYERQLGELLSNATEISPSAVTQISPPCWESVLSAGRNIPASATPTSARVYWILLVISASLPEGKVLHFGFETVPKWHGRKGCAH